MNIQEIKAVIAQMPPDDLADFARWFEEFQHNDRRHSARENVTDQSHNLLHRKLRTAGLHSGIIWVSEDFDQPLPEEFWTGILY